MKRENSVANEIYNKLKSAGKRRYIRLDHLKGFLSLEDGVYDRAVSVLDLPKTKTGASIVSGYALNFRHSVRYCYSSISKFIGVDIIINDNSGGYYKGRYLKEYKTNGNDLAIIVSKKSRVPSDFLELLINEYILNGRKNINNIFSFQKDCEYVSFVSRSEKSESDRLKRIELGIEDWVKDKIYTNPDQPSDIYFMLNGMSFRWHAHRYNWPTCMTEQRSPNEYESKIIRSGLNSGVFKHVCMYDEHTMAVALSCFS